VTIITLSSAELIQIGIAGVMRRVSAINKKRRPQHGIGPEREWQADIEGLIGEYVLAKYMDRFWSPTVGHLDKEEGDVHGYQVRATAWNRGHLLLSKGDADEDYFFLITGEDTVGLRWKVRGWIQGIDGKLGCYWASKQKDRWSYFVPQSALENMDSLPVAA